MATLSLKSTRVAVSRPRPASRRTAVVTKALTLKEASDWISSAFVRMFTPDDTNVKNVNWPANAWTGRVNHHESAKRPFKDGFTSNAPLPPSASMEPADEADAAGYVEDAVKGVVAGLRPEMENEPDWTGATTAWRGDVHSSNNKRDQREGFHVKKY